MKRPEQIPYGVKDFKRIRLEGRYYVDKTAYIRALEERADSEEVSFNLVDSFPIEKVTDVKNFKSLCYYYGIVTMSRVWRDNQLRRYAADPRIPQLSGGTPVHFIDLEFVGREMRVCEEVVC